MAYGKFAPLTTRLQTMKNQLNNAKNMSGIGHFSTFSTHFFHFSPSSNEEESISLLYFWSVRSSLDSFVFRHSKLSNMGVLHFR
jgi:hypothetical protein